MESIKFWLRLVCPLTGSLIPRTSMERLLRASHHARGCGRKQQRTILLPWNLPGGTHLDSTGAILVPVDESPQHHGVVCLMVVVKV